MVHALSDVDLDLPAGDYVSVMGPSGSGKSTLLNVLGLLDRPNAGSYRLNGVETTELPEEGRAALRRNHIGFVFQAFHLVPRLSAADNIGLPMVLAGVDPRERWRPQSHEVLESLGPGRPRPPPPDQLSGGQRQRVAIGRAIVMKPDLLLADEPTGNLDQHAGSEVIGAARTAQCRPGITLVVVTHDPAIGKRARRRIRMVDGRIESDTSGDARA